MITAASARFYQLVPDDTLPLWHGFLVKDVNTGNIVARFYQGPALPGLKFAPWVWDPQNLLHVSFDTANGAIASVEID